MTVFASPDTVDVRLDDNDRNYLIVPPGADTPVPYLRTTSFIDVVFESSHLDRWRRRLLLEHLTSDPTEIAYRVRNAESDYDVTSRSKALDQLARDLHTEAGGDDKRDYGTELHEAMRCHLLDQPYMETWPGRFTDEVTADLAAIVACLDEHQLTVDPAFVEVAVACHTLQVAGRTDGITTPGPTGRRILDLKSGSVDTAKWAMQLAVYAHADHVVTNDGRTLTPLPDDIDRNIGLILHAPKGKGKATLWTVDLTQGWEDVQVAVQVHRIQGLRQGERGVRLDPPKAGPVDTSSPFAGLPGNPSAPQAEPAAAEGPPPPSAVADPPCTPERRDWIVTRVRTIAATTARPELLGEVNAPTAAHLLAAWWPTGIPTLAEHDAHTDPQVDLIATACAQVERALELDFPADDPANPPMSETVRADDERVRTLVDWLRGLPADLADHVTAIAGEHPQATSLTTGTIPTGFVDHVAELLDDAEATVGYRAELTATLRSSLSVLGIPEAAVVDLVDTDGTDPHTWGQHTIDWFTAVVDQLETGVLAWSEAHGVTVHQETALIPEGGNRRDALTRAKKTARAEDLDAPRSFADLTGDPLLAALTLSAADTNATATDAAA